MTTPDVPIPEVPTIVDATIVQHPESGRDCLLATTDSGEQIALAFEADSDTPGLATVDPRLWVEAAREASPEHSALRFEAFDEAQADDWLQAVVAHPVGAEWLSGLKQRYPDAYHEWFAQTDYETGGEEGSG